MTVRTFAEEWSRARIRQACARVVMHESLRQTTDCAQSLVHDCVHAAVVRIAALDKQISLENRYHDAMPSERPTSPVVPPLDLTARNLAAPRHSDANALSSSRARCAKAFVRDIIADGIAWASTTFPTQGTRPHKSTASQEPTPTPQTAPRVSTPQDALTAESVPTAPKPASLMPTSRAAIPHEDSQPSSATSLDEPFLQLETVVATSEKGSPLATPRQGIELDENENAQSLNTALLSLLQAEVRSVAERVVQSSMQSAIDKLATVPVAPLMPPLRVEVPSTAPEAPLVPRLRLELLPQPPTVVRSYAGRVVKVVLAKGIQQVCDARLVDHATETLPPPTPVTPCPSNSAIDLDPPQLEQRSPTPDETSWEVDPEYASVPPDIVAPSSVLSIEIPPEVDFYLHYRRQAEDFVQSCMVDVINRQSKARVESHLKMPEATPESIAPVKVEPQPVKPSKSVKPKKDKPHGRVRTSPNLQQRTLIPKDTLEISETTRAQQHVLPPVSPPANERRGPSRELVRNKNELSPKKVLALVEKPARMTHRVDNGLLYEPLPLAEAAKRTTAVYQHRYHPPRQQQSQPQTSDSPRSPRGLGVMTAGDPTSLDLLTGQMPKTSPGKSPGQADRLGLPHTRETKPVKPKKRSGYCQRCVYEGRSCKISDCLKHQLLV